MALDVEYRGLTVRIYFIKWHTDGPLWMEVVHDNIKVSRIYNVKLVSRQVSSLEGNS